MHTTCPTQVVVAGRRHTDALQPQQTTQQCRAVVFLLPTGLGTGAIETCHITGCSWSSTPRASQSPKEWYIVTRQCSLATPLGLTFHKTALSQDLCFDLVASSPAALW